MGRAFADFALRNDMEPPAFSKYVWLPTVKAWFQKQPEVVGRDDERERELGVRADELGGGGGAVAGALPGGVWGESFCGAIHGGLSAVCDPKRIVEKSIFNAGQVA